MKNKVSSILAVSLFVLGFSSCQSNSNQNTSENTTSNSNDWTTSELAGKYSYVGNGDTITLDISSQNDSLVGPLYYSFKEKDRNAGTFRGVIKDSLLVGEYSFMSEGMNSIRETVFGIVPEGLIEGFGEIEDTGEKVIFRNIDSLRFDHGMILKKN
ncbi:MULTISPECIES: hypothetical protein [Sphingobacterium]|jgi:hypothetical protein|uniref:hypothetical protein n=1 Tax=Sphingobacterium TaxID=28453 RepID=UPI000C0C0BE9|nr:MULTISPECIES: hypothetical protein [Sphingobacterium]MCT1532732.1 hypothetical protein [Sphingobacterium daejeonense]